MNALFGSLTTEGLEESSDRLGGFSPLSTAIYSGNIKLAYAGQSTGGARNVTLVIDCDGQEHRETIYITNKKGENFFLNKQDNSKKVPLPGFTTIDDLCLIVTGKPLAEQATEEKVVNVYDADAKREVPKSVPMLVDLLNQQASFAILKILENKSEKDSNGNYVATAETRDTNSIDKVFHTATMMTVVEARQGADEPKFYQSWDERNTGKVRDKRDIKDGAASGNAGRPGANSAAPKAGQQSERKSLFANA